MTRDEIVQEMIEELRAMAAELLATGDFSASSASLDTRADTLTALLGQKCANGCRFAGAIAQSGRWRWCELPDPETGQGDSFNCVPVVDSSGQPHGCTSYAKKESPNG